MTMTNERTRSLLWAGEWLDDVLADPNTPQEIRDAAAKIVVHYPDTPTIAEMARRDGNATGFFMGELHLDTVLEYDKALTRVRDQSATTPAERTMAMILVRELTRAARVNTATPEELRRQIPYVQRHYPDIGGIEMIARSTNEEGSAPMLDYDVAEVYAKTLQASDAAFWATRKR
ncbi:hypothetical protein RCH09_003665 [Actimicrobium sp. GrIS 1.19]|uniref:BPSL0761 family protein n=1 Tax=Actimicrobium sp. GrIS 1.19 TaxID=3071708 RepID=UPI002E08E2D8|nr:hypothetical protein [Actimicrobium sp. GrIS 1.19]